MAMIPVSGAMVKIFGLQVAREYGINGFLASDGWLRGFKFRNKLVRKGTKRSPKVNPEMAEKLIEMQREK